MQAESDKTVKTDAGVKNPSEDEKTQKARAALTKEAAFGYSVNLASYRLPEETMKVEKLTDLDDIIKGTLRTTGVTAETDNRSGSFLMYNNSVSHSSVNGAGIEVMSLREARKIHDWLEDYSWGIVDADTDKYTAESCVTDADGYFIHVLPGIHAERPVQSCLMIGTEDGMQTVHNIIILEEGSQLEVLTGCVTHDDVDRALHIGVTEIYIKKNAKLTFSMIHNWDENVDVRPRTKIMIEEGGQLTNNYVCLRPAKSVQSNPTAYLNGKGASAFFNTIAVAYPGASLDLGSQVYLNAEGTKTEIISRTMTLGGEIISRGNIVGNTDGVYGHLECNGLVLDKNGVQKAIPGLESHALDVELTHEASVGRVAREQVEYLMARGLDEEEATGLIVRGFLSAGIPNIPDELKREIDEVLEKTKNANRSPGKEILI